MLEKNCKPSTIQKIRRALELADVVIVLATANGHGTNAIMRLTGKSKPCVWRWQERYVEEGVLP